MLLSDVAHAAWLAFLGFDRGPPDASRRRALRLCFKELAPGEGLEPSLSDFRDRRVATYTIPELIALHHSSYRFLFHPMSRETKGDWRESNSLKAVPQTAPEPFGFSHH